MCLTINTNLARAVKNSPGWGWGWVSVGVDGGGWLDQTGIELAPPPLSCAWQKSSNGPLFGSISRAEIKIAHFLPEQSVYRENDCLQY